MECSYDIHLVEVMFAIIDYERQVMQEWVFLREHEVQEFDETFYLLRFSIRKFPDEAMGVVEDTVFSNILGFTEKDSKQPCEFE